MTEARFLPSPSLPPGRPSLVVAGFMGTGKTESGRHAARLLGMPFIDLDDVARNRTGRPVEDLIHSRGEAQFRRMEASLVKEAARLSGSVVATGGGAVLDPESFGHLAGGAVVAVLEADPAELERRLGNGAGRPLLGVRPAERILQLLRDRGSAYRSAGEALPTDGKTPLEVGTELSDRYRREAPSGGGDRIAIEVRGPDFLSHVLIGKGAVHDLGATLRRLVPDAGRAALVVERPVEHTVGRAVHHSLEATGFPVSVTALDGGEETKTIQGVASLWEEFRDHGLDRSAVVVAVGGGAILDAVGFAAATFARGLRLVNVPTTLLAMVDAGIGGKVAVDHGGIKNLAGAFHHPRLTVVDPEALASLPVRAIRGGLAEVIKAAVVGAPMVLDVLDVEDQDGAGIPRRLPWLVEQAIRVKAGYVGADPSDRSVRKALNLGHTFAHAIESSSGYRIPHGEAVAMGLVAAARLGIAHGVTSDGVLERIHAALVGCGLPTELPPGVPLESLLPAMRADKKREGGRVAFVVPADGGAAILTDVDLEDALTALTPAEVEASG